jgi:predicted nucleic acid-binding protein
LAEDRAYIEACTVRVVSTERLHVVTDDEDDNRVLECAVAGECEYVVTGDGDLLRMGSYGGIRILRSESSLSA